MVISSCPHDVGGARGPADEDDRLVATFTGWQMVCCIPDDVYTWADVRGIVARTALALGGRGGGHGSVCDAHWGALDVDAALLGGRTARRLSRARWLSGAVPRFVMVALATWPRVGMAWSVRGGSTASVGLEVFLVYGGGGTGGLPRGVRYVTPTGSPGRRTSSFT